ncbi:MAG: diaminobutyrate--2-oxoglutarate aminotransferase [Candidatus Eremiobacteraeota bacterium]|nr:diaminobutyrate--2-oxoglutarate aminotransferase [Candidatus Eremiobacteraeota bacterium]
MSAVDIAADAATTPFTEHESNVRTYCRTFPEVFCAAHNATLVAESGRTYVDFFAAAGSLNYGHNDPRIKRAVVAYLEGDGVLQALDMYTVAKRRFISSFQDTVLAPRGLDYKLQFCGPTGANAVEAALKLSRIVTGRSGVVSFMGGYHGLSLGSLAVTGNRALRRAAGTRLDGCTFVPYPAGPSGEFDALAYLERMFTDAHSGTELPASVIVETIQAEGGVYIPRDGWLAQLAALCRAHGVLLICDEIQTGCGRTGTFFAFERNGIAPDIVCVSKSISGIGLPMAMLLIRPELDQWEPGAHTGTFRGNQLAFVAAEAALAYWRDGAFTARIAEHESVLARTLAGCAHDVPGLAVRGRGMLWALDFTRCGGGQTARRVSAEAFRRGVVVETAGRDGNVLKIMPPLTIEPETLLQGCDKLARAVRAECAANR